MLTDRSDARRVAVLRQKTLSRFKATDPTLFAGGAESVRVESVQECCTLPLSVITCINPCPPPFPVTVADNSANIVPQLVSDPNGYFWLLATSEYYDAPPCYSYLQTNATTLPDGMEYRTINNNPTWDTGVFVATDDIGSITFPVTITVTISSIVGSDAPPPCEGAYSDVTGPITFTLDAPIT